MTTVLDVLDMLFRYPVIAVNTLAAWLAISPHVAVFSIIGITGIVVLAVAVGFLLER
jgi:hypothetical protein